MKSPTALSARRRSLNRDLAAFEEADDEQQHHGADHGRHEAGEPAAVANAGKAGEEVTDQRADEADDQVHHDAVVAVHDPLGDPACEDTDDDGDEPVNAFHGNASSNPGFGCWKNTDGH